MSDPKLQAAEDRLQAAAVALRAAVLREASKHDPSKDDPANGCNCEACQAADELNEAAWEFAELKEQN